MLPTVDIASSGRGRGQRDRENSPRENTGRWQAQWFHLPSIPTWHRAQGLKRAPGGSRHGAKKSLWPVPSAARWPLLPSTDTEKTFSPQKRSQCTLAALNYRHQMVDSHKQMMAWLLPLTCWWLQNENIVCFTKACLKLVLLKAKHWVTHWVVWSLYVITNDF